MYYFCGRKSGLDLQILPAGSVIKLQIFSILSLLPTPGMHIFILIIVCSKCSAFSIAKATVCGIIKARRLSHRSTIPSKPADCHPTRPNVFGFFTISNNSGTAAISYFMRILFYLKANVCTWSQDVVVTGKFKKNAIKSSLKLPREPHWSTRHLQR